MRHRLSNPIRAVIVGAIAFAGLLLAPSLRAQGITPKVRTEASAPVSAVAELVRRGHQLETQNRWGEALTHYEQAHRTHPDSAVIDQRLQLARIHYDLGRRYADRSFRKLLVTTREHEALEMYGEMLRKIGNYHVKAPDWDGLFQRGCRNVAVALTKDSFVKRNLPDVSERQRIAFRKELQKFAATQHPRSSIECRLAAQRVARLAQQRVGLASGVTVLEFTAGAAGALDPYSTFLTGNQLKEVYSQIEGNFVGLGIELKAKDGVLQIVHVITDSPAERSGLQAGEAIVGVDGKSTVKLSTDAAANLLQGKEGTTVLLTLRAADDTLRRVQVRREHVEVPSVDDVKIIDREFGIGYAKITSFQKTTSRDLDAALWELHRKGLRSLVIDLRGNPGGLLTASVDAVDKFVESGTIVSTRGRSARENLTYTAHRVGTWRVPLVVLIDGDSASASEIFAGAIRDHQRGTIIGERSYGKGSVQGIFPLNRGGTGVRLTTAKFYSPTGRGYSKVGVSPNITVHQVAKPVIGAKPRADGAKPIDAVLEAARQTARQQLAKR
jgi:carboxyl-terminal processing protease